MYEYSKSDFTRAYQINSFFFTYHDRSSFLYNIFISALVIISIVLGILITDPSLDIPLTSIYIVDICLAVLILIETGLLLWSFKIIQRVTHSQSWWLWLPKFLIRSSTIFNILIIISIIANLITTPLVKNSPSSELNAIRIIALLRLLRVDRYTHSGAVWSAVLSRHWVEILTVLWTSALAWLLFGSLIWIAERKTQPDLLGTVPKGLYWSMISLTTVGYGDVVPLTVSGKIIACFVAIIGIVLYALPAGILGSAIALELINLRTNSRVIQQSELLACCVIQSGWRVYTRGKRLENIHSAETATDGGSSLAVLYNNSYSTSTSPMQVCRSRRQIVIYVISLLLFYRYRRRFRVLRSRIHASTDIDLYDISEMIRYGTSELARLIRNSDTRNIDVHQIERRLEAVEKETRALNELLRRKAKF